MDPPHPVPAAPEPTSPQRGEVALGHGNATGSPLPGGDRSRAKRAGEGALTFIASVGAIIARGAQALTNLMFVLVFLAFLYKIVMRYAAGDAVAWAEELTVVLFIWIVFLANGLVVDERRQIAFDLVYRNLPTGGRRRMALARSLLIGGIFVCALPAAIDYIMFLWRERTPVMGWRLDYVYACFALFMLAVIVRAIYRLALLMSARWQQGL
jgi:TRAP-type C4-dicarboxylate transport system permease small subunit